MIRYTVEFDNKAEAKEFKMNLNKKNLELVKHYYKEGKHYIEVATKGYLKALEYRGHDEIRKEEKVKRTYKKKVEPIVVVTKGKKRR